MGNASGMASDAVAVLACPVCGSGMGMSGDKGRMVACTAGHSFDVAREGYVNLLRRAVSGKYESSLFQSRRRLSEAGIWSPLLDALAEYIDDDLGENGGKTNLLDAGCGEGSHLKGLLQRLSRQERTVQGYGMDLAKEGIRLAAKHCPQAFWCAGNLAAAPFKAGSFDVIVNVLAPSNYAEFQRLLKPKGLLFKVVPNAGHLIELRQTLYRSTKNNDRPIDTASAETADLFASHLGDSKRRRLSYRVAIGEELIADLVYMTPLSWGMKEALNSVINIIGTEITVDATILIGRCG